MMRRLAFLVVAGATAFAVAGPWFIPSDPNAQQLALRLAGPSWSHPLGLDELGRDILARLAIGARVSLLVGLVVVSVSATIGVLVGAVAGYRGGLVDDVLGRVMDVLLAFPGMLLAIALVAVLGPSIGHVVIALGVIGWVGYARLVRGQVLKIREFDYVHAAHALGASSFRILLRHVLPATLAVVTVQATLGMAGAVLAEASLSFLGLGVQPPTPSWGAMLDAGRSHLLDAPHLAIAPGAAIAFMVLSFNLAGDVLRDKLDPKT
jgi:peptide/nickel transport system permease protein